jgi:hypothetical protein
MEGFGLDRRDLVRRVELQDRGVQEFQIANHLAQRFVCRFYLASERRATLHEFG